ncbi:MAG: hypothetical protein UV95_C0001G0166 [Candidatus Falkowbacteria bacterium GW2011_GWF2_43_32]|nr:MAG: hypothetical protein UV95_C0001G0166 [Candidatus Falkowbacteria bacterium GW2011_GWF2_43_32]
MRPNKLSSLVAAVGIFFLFFVLFGFLSVSAASSFPANLSAAVPFTAQAPLAEWQDQRQEDGCEEATALMALAWVRGETGFDRYEWRARILKLSDWEKATYGEDRDVALFDMLVWIFGDYFSHGNVALKPIRETAEMIGELDKGHLVLVPLNGQALGNPYFTPPGPERHMILIKGYDYETAEFITNDPGTRRGEDYRYSADVLFRAIRPYATGFHEPFPLLTKEMLVVGK